MYEDYSVLKNRVSAKKVINKIRNNVVLADNPKSLITFIVSLLLLQGCNNFSLNDKPSEKEKIKPIAEKIEIVEVIKVAEDVVEPEVEVPDFNAFNNVRLKKETFFNFIYDYVETVNIEIKTRRSKISAIAQKSILELNAEDRLYIDRMSTLYLHQHDSADTLSTAKILLNHVDIVPPSLALAQAANESAWGTSRFATDANNYFGQWCFREGCGLVPEQRSLDSSFEVRKFQTVEDSVRSYIRNINTHRAYAELRKIRREIRLNGEFPGGEILSDGLHHYSQKGEQYISELQSIIRFNELETYDEKLLNSLYEVNRAEIDSAK